MVLSFWRPTHRPTTRLFLGTHCLCTGIGVKAFAIGPVKELFWTSLKAKGEVMDFAFHLVVLDAADEYLSSVRIKAFGILHRGIVNQAIFLN